MPLFVSDDEFSPLSGDTAAVAAHIRGLLEDLDTIRAQAYAAEMQKYLSLAAEFSKLETSLDQRLRDHSDAQSQNHQNQLQSVEKDREIERLRIEVSELHKSKRQLIELNEQKDMELSEKSATVRSYFDKIVSFSPTRMIAEWLQETANRRVEGLE